jgi:hypothetical protein
VQFFSEQAFVVVGALDDEERPWASLLVSEGVAIDTTRAFVRATVPRRY